MTVAYNPDPALAGISKVRGGRRPGAGRKRGIKRSARRVSLSDDEWAEVVRVFSKVGKTPTMALRALAAGEWQPAKKPVWFGEPTPGSDLAVWGLQTGEIFFLRWDESGGLWHRGKKTYDMDALNICHQRADWLFTPVQLPPYL